VTLIGGNINCFVLAALGKGGNAQPLHCIHAEEETSTTRSDNNKGSNTHNQERTTKNQKRNQLNAKINNRYNNHNHSNHEKEKEQCSWEKPFERYLDLSFGVDEFALSVFATKEDLGMWMGSLMTHLQVKEL